MAALNAVRLLWLVPLWIAGADLARAAEPDAPAPGGTAVASSDLPIVQPGGTGPCQAGAGADAGAIFVAPDGDDAQDGAAARPVLTLDRALALLSSTGLRTAYLRGGAHLLAQPLVIGSGHAGTRLLGCPGERPMLQGAQGLPDALVLVSDTHGVTVAGLAFGPTTPGGTALTLDHARDCLIEGNDSSDAGTAILLDHASGNRLARNIIRNAASTGIELRDASDDNLVEENRISGAGAPETHGGGIFLHGVRRNRVAANLVEDTAGMGIGVSNWNAETVNVGNAVVGNIVRRVNLTAMDSGAIYLLGRSQVDTRALVAFNWVDGVGVPDPDSQRHNVGIYLDDSTSGAVVVGNVVRHVGSDAVQIHGGSGNLIANNILDLGEGHPSAVLFQAAPADTNPTNAQVGNIVTRNIIISANATPKVYVWLDGGQPLIRRNLYYSSLGASMATNPPAADANPVLGDPGFADPARGDYALGQGTPAALIGFQPIAPPRLPRLGLPSAEPPRPAAGASQ